MLKSKAIRILITFLITVIISVIWAEISMSHDKKKKIIKPPKKLIVGFQGLQGLQGNQGLQGLQGLQGFQGLQ
ncbi:MAG: hypothetical protein GF384_04880 [Elusimicrobia bacterium]|nr:hypothetical protein [Elusimicrobiota bacterium]